MNNFSEQNLCRRTQSLPEFRRSLNFAVLLFLPILISGCEKRVAEKDDGKDSRSASTTQDTKREVVLDSGSDVLKLLHSKQADEVAQIEREHRATSQMGVKAIIEAIHSLDLDGKSQDRAILSRLFLALAHEEPGKFFEMLRTLPGGYYKTAIADAFPYLAKSRPEILENYVSNTKDDTDQNRWLILGACELLGKYDPCRAVGFFDNMPDSFKSSSAAIGLLKNAASIDPEVVVRHLEQKRNESYFVNSYREVLYTILVNNPEMALDLASSHPDVQDTRLSAGIYSSMARKDPLIALDKITNASPDVRLEVLKRRGIDNHTYFEKLFLFNPVKTIGLFKGIVPSMSSASLYEVAAKRLSNMAPSPEKNESVRLFADAVRTVDPETADLWLNSLK